MLVWVTLFLLLILIEAFIGDFTALTISIGALASIVPALMGMGFLSQVAVFSCISILAVIILRPLLQQKFVPNRKSFTIDSFLGAKAEVIEKITPNHKGKVKINGEIWFAESNVEIHKGNNVIISEIDGTILKVVPETHILKPEKSLLITETENKLLEKGED